jgi:hypothetical protein
MKLLQLLKNPPDWVALVISAMLGGLLVGSFHALIWLKNLIETL